MGSKEHYLHRSGRSRDPLVTGVEWQYWDLYQLEYGLRHARKTIPPEIRAYQGRFDLALLMSGGGALWDPNKSGICDFFVRLQGYSLIEGIFHKVQ